jgi:hypothetical protein
MKTQVHLARAAACLLLAMAGAHVHAQQATSAADSQAAVPATRYQSALGKRPEPAPESSPDRNWVASNQTVAATNSMALTMKPMGGQAADPHAGHAGMHGMGMDKKESGGMCTPGDKAGDGKMSCCGSGCGSGCDSCCCKDKMKKDKETP